MPTPLPSLPASLQALPPSAAHFCLEVQRFLEHEPELFIRGRAILVGLSGGADSSALLLCLHYLAPRMDLSVYAAHLDHALRPTSIAEAQYCQKLCRSMGIPLQSRRIDVAALAQKNATGIEEAGRLARYAFFKEAAKACSCSLIATGHTANDLAEDVLMRLARGCGWPGLAGMRAHDAKRALVRPLLLTSRAAIEDFVASFGLGWVRDESNTDEQYTRNRIRARMLPLFLDENPAFLESVIGLWRLGRMDERCFDQLLAQHLNPPASALSMPGPGDKACGMAAPFLRTPPCAVSRTTLLPLPQALRMRFYKQRLDALGPGQVSLGALLSLDASVVQGNCAQHSFAGGKRVAVTHKSVSFSAGHAGR